MNKKLLLMILLVVGLGAITVFLFTQRVYGEVVFRSDSYPYEIQIVSSSGVQAYDCESSECLFELTMGDYEAYMEKEGYYSVSTSFSLEKGDKLDVDFSFEVIPALVESELETATVDEAIFDVCYGDSEDCEIDDLYFVEADESTGYMTLWEGEVRRATFTSGMEESKVFVGGNGALVWDAGSGDAYFVDFLEDSREYLFTVAELEGVMFLDDGGYIVDAGDLYWWQGEALAGLPFNWGLLQITYNDGRIYFLAEGSELGDEASGVVVGSYDGEEIYVIVEELEVVVEDSMMASDEDGVYVMSEGEVWELRVGS